MTCCKQSLLWNSLWSDNPWQEILPYLRNISINLPPFQQQGIWLFYSSFRQDNTAFSTAESCCSHLLCPSCCDGNLVDTFYVQKFIEQENLTIQISKIIFLDVVKKLLVDAEQSMGNFGSQVLFIHYFLVSAANSAEILHQNLQQICYPFSIVYVRYIEAKNQSITFKYTLILTILNPKYFSTSHWDNKTPLHCRFSQVFKIK